MAVISLVHWQTGAEQSFAQAAKTTLESSETRGQKGVDLPPGVVDMREAILLAVRNERIEELRTAIDWNELPPELGGEDGVDPIAHLRSVSGDADGGAILKVLGTILEMAPAVVHQGADIENNRVFVWPYLAELSPDRLSEAQQADALKLMSAEELQAMRAARAWKSWRLMIGADGTWHSFFKVK